MFDAIDAHTIVFGIGARRHRQDIPGNGQGGQRITDQGRSNRIILHPPSRGGPVSASASCQATLYEKIDPYLRPLYDALHDMMDPELIPKLMEWPG